jgi:hypothetical protein
MFTLKIGKLLSQDFSSVKDASNAYQDLRDELGLGASEFPSGNLRNKETRVAFKISYNGRVWDSSNNEVAL